MIFKKNSITKFFLSCLCILVSSMYTHAQNIVALTDDTLNYSIRSASMEVFEDTNNSCTSIENLQTKKFKAEDSYFFSSPNPSSTYWGRFSVTDNSSINNHWFFISYNYSIDSLDIFAYKKLKLLFHKQYRFNAPDSTTQEIRHKHFTIDFPILKNDTVLVYVKLKNKNATQYDFALVEHKNLFSKSVFEF